MAPRAASSVSKTAIDRPLSSTGSNQNAATSPGSWRTRGMTTSCRPLRSGSTDGSTATSTTLACMALPFTTERTWCHHAAGASGRDRVVHATGDVADQHERLSLERPDALLVTAGRRPRTGEHDNDHIALRRRHHGGVVGPAGAVTRLVRDRRAGRQRRRDAVVHLLPAEQPVELGAAR